MTAQLIELIDAITVYGIKPCPHDPDRLLILEKDLVKLYALYFETPDVFDEKEYPDSNWNHPDLLDNIRSNFPSLGFYKTVLNMSATDDSDDTGLSDAIDDLGDIISELLEVKWRLLHNSETEGLWRFKLAFSSHIKHHLLGLLGYLAERD